MLGTLTALVLLQVNTATAAMRLDVGGMSCGEGCPPKVEKALLGVDGVTAAVIDFHSNSACIETSQAIAEQRLADALAAHAYTLGSVADVESCAPPKKVNPRDPWANTAGVDAAIISHGETIDLDAARVPGKFTIFDFGAPWCGPCHVAANRLRALMPETPDLAVRAISLGEDPKASFDFPVVKQHMAFASGIPWFIVVAPNGRKIYEGPELDDALRNIERKRK